MDADKETVLLCHMGVRSRHVAGFLASQVPSDFPAASPFSCLRAIVLPAACLLPL